MGGADPWTPWILPFLAETDLVLLADLAVDIYGASLTLLAVFVAVVVEGTPVI